MEIGFTIKVTDEHIIQINHIRYAINILVGIRGEEIKLTPRKVEKIQKKIRGYLIDFVTNNFEDMDVTPFHKEYRWNLVPEERVKDAIDYHIEDNALYQMHNAIFFTASGPRLEPRIKELIDNIKKCKPLVGDSQEPFVEEVVCCPCQVMINKHSSFLQI